ncbi:MAG: MFS transporter [Burkholderiales bacterium]
MNAPSAAGSSVDWRTPTVVLACAAAILFIALGTRQGFGLFLQPMCSALGWGRETFSAAIALQNLLWGLAQPFTGAIADRFGAGRVLVIGGLCYGAGLVLMAYSSTGFELGLTAGFLIGIGLSACSFGVVLGVVGRRAPPARRTVALGIAGAGGSVGQFAMLPYTQVLIGQFGWFNALVILAASAFLIVPLGAALAGRTTHAHGTGQGIGEALREAAHHKGFWLLTGSFLVCGFQTIFIMVHLPAYLVDRGGTALQGMTALAAIGLANVAGSFLCGYLGDRYSKKHLLGTIYWLRAAAIAAFVSLPLSTASIALFAAVMGFTWLGTVPLTNSLVAQIFGVQYLSTLFSIAWLGHQVGAFAGAWLGGYAFDATGSYTAVWIIAIGASVVAALACLPIDERTLRAAPGVSGAKG